MVLQVNSEEDMAIDEDYGKLLAALMKKDYSKFLITGVVFKL